MRITYLSLTDDDKTLAAMRSAQLRLGLSEYVATLVRNDAERAGLTDYLSNPAHSVNGPALDEGKSDP